MANKNSDKITDERLESLIGSVVSTLDFHGVTIKGMKLSRLGLPSFKVAVSKKKRSKSLDDTLNFTYWTLWTLLYGKYEDSKSELKLNLDYTEEE